MTNKRNFQQHIRLFLILLAFSKYCSLKNKNIDNTKDIISTKYVQKPHHSCNMTKCKVLKKTHSNNLLEIAYFLIALSIFDDASNERKSLSSSVKINLKTGAYTARVQYNQVCSLNPRLSENNSDQA